jgi:transcriptional regulator with XRE-family HTH domain
MTAAQDLLDEVRLVHHMPAPNTARFIRQAARVSQTRMATALGVDRTTLSRWEAGTMQPRAAQRRRWAELLAALQREVAA